MPAAPAEAPRRCGPQYTSLAFGRRCREVGVVPSMGSVGDAYDNALTESFFASPAPGPSTIDSISAIISAREPGARLDDYVKEWRSRGGDQAREEYEEALAKG